MIVRCYLVIRVFFLFDGILFPSVLIQLPTEIICFNTFFTTVKIGDNGKPLGKGECH